MTGAKTTQDTSLPPGMRSEERRNLVNKVIKDKITIEKYGAETNGELTLIRATVGPGGGSPPSLPHHLLRTPDPNRRRPRGHPRRGNSHEEYRWDGPYPHEHETSLLQPVSGQRRDFHGRGEACQ
jgi:hypothetical protein